MKSEVHIETLLKRGNTILSKACCTQPFKVMNVTEDPRDGLLKLMLTSSSPGILDGDAYDIKVSLGEDCALEMQTQSYQRLFTMKKGARQSMEIHLQKDALFKFLPHPTVPHESANFLAHNSIYLSGGCTLIWGEVLTCGRKLNGEIFRFTRYQAVTEIFLNGRLVIKENLFIQPGSMDISGMGLLEGFTHQASLIYLGERISVKEMIGLVSGWLDRQEEIIYGITAAPLNGIIVRILGYKAEQLHYCVSSIATLISNG